MRVARTPLMLRPYTPGDEVRFIPRADFAAAERVVAHDWSEGPPSAVTWTITRWGGEVVGLAGAKLHNGECHLWAYLADLAPRDFGWLLRLARSRIHALHRTHRPHVFFADVSADSPAAFRTLRKLGFTADRAFTVAGLGRHIRMRRP